MGFTLPIILNFWEINNLNNNIKLKVCSKCKKEKLLNEFYNNKKSKDGKTVWCVDCIKKYRKDYYQIDKNKKRSIFLMQEWRRKNPYLAWAKATILRHKKRGYKVCFSFTELGSIAEETTFCPICGTKLNWGVGNKGNGPEINSPTLDRIYNQQILELHSVQIICNRCNAAKLTGTMEDLITWCKQVVKNMGDKINEA